MLHSPYHLQNDLKCAEWDFKPYYIPVEVNASPPDLRYMTDVTKILHTYDVAIDGIQVRNSEKDEFV